MKKRYLLFAALPFALLVLAACAPKSSVTLDLGGGGTLGKTSVQVPVGSSLGDALKDVAPTPDDGLTFAGWYLGGAPVTDETVPAEGVTVTAKYYASYTAELYFEGTDGSYGAAETVTGQAIWQEPFTYEPAREHFVLDDAKDNRLSAEPLGKSEVFTAYMRRELAVLTYSPNLPQGTAYTAIPAFRGKFGDEVVLADGNTFGAPLRYRFLGWSEQSGGEVTHPAGEAFSLGGSCTLYAVWQTGYVDRFGGSDVIFKSESGVILVRGGMQFEGTLDGSTFTFQTKGGTLSGKLYETTFSFFTEDGAGTYTLLENGEIVANQTLTVDEFRNATSTVGTAKQRGYVYFDEDIGDWCFIHESGAFGYRFRLSESNGRPVFIKGGNEAGNYIGIAFEDEAHETLMSSGYSLFLDGYGAAILTPLLKDPQTGTYEVLGAYDTGTSENMYVVTASVGGREYTLCTVLLEGDSNGFLFADGTRGTYAGTGGTLTLDGFGLFEDSAVYAAGSETVRGTYTVERFLTAGTLLTLTPANGRGARSFLLDGDTFTVPDGSGIPLYELNAVQRTGSTYSLISPLLVLYDNGRASLFWEKADGSFECGATGTYAETRLAENVYSSVFTTSETTEGYEGRVPTSFSYLVGGIAFDNITAEVYFVREWDGAPRYTEWTGRGGERIEFQDLPMGSLYFDADGHVYQGTVTDRIQNTDFGVYNFRFTYFDQGMGNFNTFLFAANVEGDEVTSFLPVEAVPTNYFLTDDRGVTELFASLALDGNGVALYAETEDSEPVTGTYRMKDVTAFGDLIYTFSAGSVRFDFILGIYYDLYSDVTYDVYYRYNAALDGMFEDRYGPLFEADGFYRAAYFAGEMYEGTYALTEDGSAVYFVSETGEEHYFLIDGTSAVLLGTEYGEWDLVDQNYSPYAGREITVRFDGLSEVVFTLGTREIVGSYRAVGMYNGMPELEISAAADIGLGKTFVVSLMKILMGDRYCVPFDSGSSGVFISDDWAVLVLDGYGYGTLYGADGSAGRRVIYTVYSAEKGHFALQPSGNYNYIPVVLDRENNSFSLPTYTEYSYYGDDFAGIRFDASGGIGLFGESGRYFIEENGVTAYFLQDDGTYAARSLFLPGAATATYLGKTYRLFDGEAVTVRGTIEMRDGNGLVTGDPISATLTFTPDGEPSFEAAATVTTDTSYSGFVFAVRYSAGSVVTRLRYAGTEYPVSFARTDTLTFTAIGGDTTTVFADADNTNNSRGALTMRAFGFGPIDQISPTVEGDLAYSDGTNSYTFSFTVSAEEVKVAGRSADYGDRYLLTFEHEGTAYALTYYLTENSYYLHALATYREFASGTFSVGIFCYLYGHGNFPLVSETKGAVCDLVLFEDGTPLPETELASASNAFVYTADERSFTVELTLEGGTPTGASVTERH